MLADKFGDLQTCLACLAGEPDHKFPDGDLRLVGLSAALLDSDSKKRLKLLEAVGDNALSMAVASRCLARGLSAQTYQEARSVVTSNGKLAELFVKEGLDKFVSFAAGVVPSSKVGANSMEAFAGLIYADLGMSGVISFCTNSGLFLNYTLW